jgi:hypothetical protein
MPQPFGPHTRVVLLANQVHAWVGAVDALLAMVDRNGLGTRDAPVPIVLTAALREKQGGSVRTFRDDRAGVPGYRFPELTSLPPPEATLGFQWVLLHPWQLDRGPDFRMVYTPARGITQEQVQRGFRVFHGRPTAVVDDLYLLVQSLCGFGVFTADDDEQDYDDYERRFA